MSLSNISQYARASLITSISFLSLTTYGANNNTTIDVTGKVYAAACTVNIELTNGLSVEFDPLGRSHFLVAGSASNWKNFSLELSMCPSSTTTSTVTFTGTPDINDANLFANTAIDGANGIAVQMTKGDDHSIVLSNNSTLTATVDGGMNMTFPLAARLYTPVGGVSAGLVSSTVLVNFTYQ